MCTGGYTRAHIRHMVTVKEMLGGILLSMHNIYYLLDLMRRARQAIIDGTYSEFVTDWMASPAAKDCSEPCSPSRQKTSAVFTGGP